MKPALTHARVTCAFTAAATAFDVPLAVLRTSREPRPSTARFAVYAALKHETDATISGLGRALERDHSTLLHGLGRADALALCDADFAAALDQVCHAVRGAAAHPALATLAATSQELRDHLAILPASALLGIAAELRTLLRLVEAAQVAHNDDTDPQTARLYREVAR